MQGHYTDDGSLGDHCDGSMYKTQSL